MAISMMRAERAPTSVVGCMAISMMRAERTPTSVMGIPMMPDNDDGAHAHPLDDVESRRTQQ